MNPGIVKYINETFGISATDTVTLEQLQIILAEKINYLIIHDFTLLVRLLYRIDVSEKKLKEILKENIKLDAGIIIATLVIERQLQKIISRKLNNPDIKNIIDDEDSW